MKLFEHIKHYFIPSEGNAYRPTILHRPWLIFFFVIILATEGFLVSNLIVRQSSQNFLAAVVSAEIISLTNSERASNGAGALQEDALLDRAAQAKANDMASKGYFAHNGPDGKTPWQWIAESGYQYQYAGENLAVRFIDSADVVNAWMDSPTHRANMVKPVYTAIGVGVAQGMFEGQSATYVVQYFGAPLVAPEQHAPIAAVAPAASSTSPESGATAAPLAAATGGHVEGTSVSVGSAPPVAPNAGSFWDTVTRQVVRLFGEPQRMSNAILALCAGILVIALCLTFFMHMHIQPTNMLIGGVFVAFFALSLLALNTHLTAGGGSPNGSLSASAIEGATPGGVVIDSDAASTGYALFPRQ